MTSDTEKLYNTRDAGVASFIWYVTAGEDTFVRVDVDDNNRPTIWSRDAMENNSCSALETMYRSGARLTDVQEFVRCFNLIGYKLRKATRASNTH
jgi:hypothetical protein